MSYVNINKCIAWLPFDNSPSFDVMKNNWTVSGSPTISAVNAISGNALQLDGSSYLKLSNIQLGGKDFTIDGWFYVDSTTVPIGGLFCICNPDNNQCMVAVRKNVYGENGQDRINLWYSTTPTVSDGKGIGVVSSYVGVGELVHVALVYQYKEKNLRLWINGRSAAITDGGGGSALLYYRRAYDIYIGTNRAGSNFYKLTGSVDEFRIHDGIALWTKEFKNALPTIINTNALEFNLATTRTVRAPSAEWEYRNIGLTTSLVNTTTAVQLTSLPATQSKSGKAFYQTTSQIRLFDVPSSKEVWMKFDVYFNGTKRWRAYDSSAGNITGVTAQTSGDISYFNRGSNVYQVTNTAKINELQTVILHMIADSANGRIEVFTNDGGLVHSYSGEVNNGTSFSTLYLQSDGAGTFFSNIIISNHELTMDDDTVRQVALNVDMERKVNADFSFLVDVVREVFYGDATVRQVDLNLDLERKLSSFFTLHVDLECSLLNDTTLYVELERHVMGDIESYVDLERKAAVDMSLTLYTSRLVIVTPILNLSTERFVFAGCHFYVSTVRMIPYQLVINSLTRNMIPIGKMPATPATPTRRLLKAPKTRAEQQPGYLQSINIQIAEQQITDRVSFVHTGNCEIMELIQGTYYDYVFSLRVEEVQIKGALESAECCSDIDELLYSQIAYHVPEDKYEWSNDYLNQLMIARQGNPDDDIRAQPSTTIQGHLSVISEKLGKTLVYRGRDWYSTNKTNENGGKTYASLLSELLGWTSRLPHMEINCFIRNDALYAIQRGYEANTVNLDEWGNVTVPTITKKVIRTTWGSDVWSKTTVTTGTHTWDEEELEPYTPESPGTGSSSNDEGLVEQTSEETETTRTTTTYQYDTDDRTGGKVLRQEITEKYEKDSGTGTWVHVDTIVKTHRRVSPTQSYTVAKDADGDIIGESVSQNRFDDRATPFVQGFISKGNRGFATVHDSQGNAFKLYRISHCSEEVETGKKTVYGLSLVDTSFPVYGDDNLSYLTQQLIWLNRKTEETVTLDIYGYEHIVGFDDKIIYNGNIYFLKSNTVTQTETIVNKQSLSFVRWY